MSSENAGKNNAVLYEKLSVKVCKKSSGIQEIVRERHLSFFYKNNMLHLAGSNRNTHCLIRSAGARFSRNWLEAKEIPEAANMPSR